MKNKIVYGLALPLTVTLQHIRMLFASATLKLSFIKQAKALGTSAPF